MSSGKLVLFLGGARSGKSECAENFASKLSDQVIYIATAAELDLEMVRRIKRHRERRPATWQTVEETTNLIEVIEEYGAKSEVILLDCLTLWISNLLIDESRSSKGISWPEKESYILAKVEQLAQLAKQVAAHVIVVANEVSLGVIPDNRLGRSFRDVAGYANQLIARQADEVYLTIAGLPIELKELSNRFVR